MKKTAILNVCALLVFAIVCVHLDYLYVKYDPWPRFLADSYHAKEEIDNLFVGSSHVMCDVNPDILDNTNGMSNFNLSSGGQGWDVSYYLVRDAIKRYDIKNVYLECWYPLLIEKEEWNDSINEYEMVDRLDSESHFANNWSMSYWMGLSDCSARILFSTLDSDHAIETLFPFARYRENLFNYDYIRGNINTKHSDEFDNTGNYAEQRIVDGITYTSKYLKGGFHRTDGLWLHDKNKVFSGEYDLVNNDLGEKSIYYFKKTIELCLENDVSVKLFISPVYDGLLIAGGENGYDAYRNRIMNIANEYNLEFYDFNLIKPTVLDLGDGYYYRDDNHLNGKGADVFTPILWDVLSSDMDENIDVFYSSYKEKNESEDAHIYGIYYNYLYLNEAREPLESSEYVTKYTIASNKESMEYKVLRTIDGQEDKTPQILQDYSINKSFELPIEDKGLFYIFGRYDNKDLKLCVEYGED